MGGIVEEPEEGAVVAVAEGELEVLKGFWVGCAVGARGGWGGCYFDEFCGGEGGADVVYAESYAVCYAEGV